MRPPVAARVEKLPGGAARVELVRPPKTPIAPGQACVFYQDSRVLGGGWITAADAVPVAGGPLCPPRAQAR